MPRAAREQRDQMSSQAPALLIMITRSKWQHMSTWYTTAGCRGASETTVERLNVSTKRRLLDTSCPGRTSLHGDRSGNVCAYPLSMAACCRLLTRVVIFICCWCNPYEHTSETESRCLRLRLQVVRPECEIIKMNGTWLEHGLTSKHEISSPTVGPMILQLTLLEDRRIVPADQDRAHSQY